MTRLATSNKFITNKIPLSTNKLNSNHMQIKRISQISILMMISSSRFIIGIVLHLNDSREIREQDGNIEV